MNLREAKESVQRGARWLFIRQRDPWTFVQAFYSVGWHSRWGYGWSKRMWRDKPNPELGLEIAKGRAIADIARQLVKEG